MHHHRLHLRRKLLHRHHPFEEIFADLFGCGGQYYLVVGDRLSGWYDVFKSPSGSPQAGAQGLITCLRNYFARFGVPMEI